MRFKMRYMTVVLLIVLSVDAYSQSHNEQVTVEGTYRPQIRKSERIAKEASAPNNNFNIPDYKANTSDFDFKYEMEIESVSPNSYVDEQTQLIYNNFLKAGLGTMLSPVFLYSHYSDITRSSSLGIGVRHNSTWLNMKDYSSSSFMNNAFNIGMLNKFKVGQLKTDVDYRYDMYHLRAVDINDPLIFVNNDNGRNIHSLNATAAFAASGSSYKSLYEEIKLDYQYTGICGSVNEHLIQLKSNLCYSDNWMGNKDNNVQTLGADVDIAFNKLGTMLTIVKLSPYFDMNGAFYRMRLGVNLDVKTNDSDSFGLHPDIEAALFVLNNKLEFYASLSGDNRFYTLKDILADNPFIITNFKFGDFGYEKTRVDLRAGIKVNILNDVDVHAGMRYRKINNDMFFVATDDFYAKYEGDENTYRLMAFDIMYANCNEFNFMANLRWKINVKWSFSADFAYNTYALSMPDGMNNDSGLDTLYSHAWYKPGFELCLKTDYKMNEKWRFDLSAMMWGKRYSLEGNLDAMEYVVSELEPLFDLQLGANYEVKDNFTVFAEIHNVLNDKYQIYYSYPSYGFQLYLGIKYRF